MNIQSIYTLLKGDLHLTQTDTRKLKAGEIFFALKGPHFNGNLFVHDALRLGAKFVIMEEGEPIADSRVIQVPDVLLCMQKLANLHRKTLGTKVIGITGSNGKTTTKELLYAICSLSYNTIATTGNLNNHIGVPLTLFRLKPETELLLLEMGANQPGDIEELCKIGEPDWGLITSLGRAHLEGFGSFENIVQTKTDLFRWVQGVHGINFYNLNDENLKLQYERNAEAISFGDSITQADYVYELIQSHPKLLLNAIKPKRMDAITSNLFGIHNYQNVIASITIALQLGITEDKIRSGLKNYVAKNMRSEIREWNGNQLILDAYNANPDSMRNALKSLCEYGYEKKYAILGFMAEMGNSSADEHLKLQYYAGTLGLEKVFLIGPHWNVSALDERSMIFESIEDLKKYLLENPIEQSVILLKGSRAAALEQLLME